MCQFHLIILLGDQLYLLHQTMKLTGEKKMHKIRKKLVSYEMMTSFSLKSFCFLGSSQRPINNVPIILNQWFPNSAGCLIGAVEGDSR